MAKKVKKTKTVDKWRKKRYFSLFAPKQFQERELGQSIAYGPDELMGRRVSSNLMILTGNVKKQNINITFRVNKVKGDSAYTMIDQYSVAPAAIKRKVRRQKDRIDESIKLVTKDNISVRIKPLIITVNKVSNSVTTALRSAAIKYMEKYIGETNYDQFVNDLIIEKFQRELRGSLSKLTPVKSVDVRVMKCLGESKKSSVEKEDVKVAPEEKTEVKEEKPETKAEEPEADVEPAAESAA